MLQIKTSSVIFFLLDPVLVISPFYYILFVLYCLYYFLSYRRIILILFKF